MNAFDISIALIFIITHLNLSKYNRATIALAKFGLEVALIVDDPNTMFIGECLGGAYYSLGEENALWRIAHYDENGGFWTVREVEECPEELRERYEAWAEF